VGAGITTLTLTQGRQRAGVTTGTLTGAGRERGEHYWHYPSLG